MSQSLAPDRPQKPSLADIALSDLAAQFSRVAKELAIVRAQYQELVDFVESKSEVLGLTKVDGDQAEAPRNGAVADSRAEDKWPNTKE